MAEVVYVPHVCDKPNATDHVTGTIWLCDCGKHWILKYLYSEMKMEYIYFWKEASRKELRKVKNKQK